ncbi:unnamed protein product [Linum trigynum]|uniref:Uncharacterized protein n=1 Tax=Linum trigynum TaxID=586398 RepID=A0AAV2D127_9ROSI
MVLRTPGSGIGGDIRSFPCCVVVHLGSAKLPTLEQEEVRGVGNHAHSSGMVKQLPGEANSPSDSGWGNGSKMATTASDASEDKCRRDIF